MCIGCLFLFLSLWFRVSFQYSRSFISRCLSVSQSITVIIAFKKAKKKSSSSSPNKTDHASLARYISHARHATFPHG
ncbi:hypothetical protein V8C37DRAFT_364840 [Trichoderma ceciliae]